MSVKYFLSGFIEMFYYKIAKELIKLKLFSRTHFVSYGRVLRTTN